MIISIYEDKISRLKKIEEVLNAKITTLDENNQESKLIIDYYKNEKENYTKLLVNTHRSIEANQFLKTLLLEAINTK